MLAKCGRQPVRVRKEWMSADGMRVSRSTSRSGSGNGIGGDGGSGNGNGSAGFYFVPPETCSASVSRSKVIFPPANYRMSIILQCLLLKTVGILAKRLDLDKLRLKNRNEKSHF